MWVDHSRYEKHCTFFQLKYIAIMMICIRCIAVEYLTIAKFKCKSKFHRKKTTIHENYRKIIILNFFHFNFLRGATLKRTNSSKRRRDVLLIFFLKLKSISMYTVVFDIWWYLLILYDRKPKMWNNLVVHYKYFTEHFNIFALLIIVTACIRTFY